MDSTPLREAVLKTQLDLTLSGIRHTRYRNFSFEGDLQSPITALRTPTPLRKRIQPKVLPTIPTKSSQQTQHNQTKAPIPKRSFSPTLRQSTLERRNNNNNNILRKSGSLSELPICVVSPIVRPHRLFDEYSVGQPVLKVPRTPRYPTQPDKYKTLEPINKSNLTAFQSSPKGSLTPFTTKRTPPLNLESQRLRVIRELVDTEETYIMSLRNLTSYFYRPLQKGKLLPADELKQLFPPQLNTLLSCHTELLEKLKERLSNPKFRSVIGDIFADLCPGSMTMDFFQMYSGYVQAFPMALAIYDRHIRTNKEFRGFIHACMESPVCRGLDLTAFLLTPIQRLPRYLLLLNELSKYTSPTHPDWYYASLASDNFKACLVLLNESIHHVLDVASQSAAWQSETRAKHSSRSMKSRKQSKRVSKSGITRAGSNSDLNSNTSSMHVESCPPSIFPAKYNRLPVLPQRRRVTSVEHYPPALLSALLSAIEPSCNKRHLRKRSSDRIFRLFRKFRSK